MKKNEIEKAQLLLEEGNLGGCRNYLAPYLKANDLDARYFSVNFFTGESRVSDREFERRRIDGLVELAQLGYPQALFDLGWMHFHGDDGIAQDRAKFMGYISAAAILGYSPAIEYILEYFNKEFDWSSELDERVCSMLHRLGSSTDQSDAG